METIFAKLLARMLEGMVFHDEMAKYFSFLNLKGYCKCHEYHYAEETKGYRELSRYYMGHHHKLIPVLPMARPDVIPQSWYSAKQDQVDIGTKQNGVRSGMEKWVAWERETKEIYQDAYLSLIEMGEPAAAEYVLKLVRDVDYELMCAEKKHLTLESIGFDLITIVSAQDDLYERYKCKLSGII